MKIDLVGPERRGFALGVNESAGYSGVALAALASGWLASEFVARDVLVVGAVAVAVAGLIISALFVRDTGAHVDLEQSRGEADPARSPPGLRDAFADGTYRAPALRSCSQAGFVNNLNDALAWGLVPLFLSAEGAGVGEIGLVAGIYPAVWGLAQLWTGHWSDSVGRKQLIVAGMLVQAAALGVLAVSGGAVAAAIAAAVGLGAGTALAYPTLIAAVSDAVSPVERATAVGVYRFWRDMGYVAGGLLVGVVADALDFGAATALAAGLTALSAVLVATDLRARRERSARPAAASLPGP
jgi:MFS family permease